jgi:hypothetical protein
MRNTEKQNAVIPYISLDDTKEVKGKVKGPSLVANPLFL